MNSVNWEDPSTYDGGFDRWPIVLPRMRHKRIPKEAYDVRDILGPLKNWEDCAFGHGTKCQKESHRFVLGTLPEPRIDFECLRCGISKPIPGKFKITRKDLRVTIKHKCRRAA